MIMSGLESDALGATSRVRTPAVSRPTCVGASLRLIRNNSKARAPRRRLSKTNWLRLKKGNNMYSAKGKSSRTHSRLST